METLLFHVGDRISPVKDITFKQDGIEHKRFHERQYEVLPKFVEWYNLHSDLFYKVSP